MYFTKRFQNTRGALHIQPATLSIFLCVAAILFGGCRNLPFSVEITSPVNGTTYTTPQTIRFTAESSVPLAQVDFFRVSDAPPVLVHSDFEPPFTFEWPISARENGRHGFFVQGYDEDGRFSMSTYAVNIDVEISIIRLTNSPLIPFPGSLSPSLADRKPNWYHVPFFDESARTRTYDVTNESDMAALGCAGLRMDPADGADRSDQAGWSCIWDNATGVKVYMPAGVYNVAEKLVARSGEMFTLYGDGEASVIEFSGYSPAPSTFTCYGSYLHLCPSDWPRAAASILSGGHKGSTSLTLSTTAGLRAGQAIRVQSDWPAGLEGIPSPINGPADGNNFGEFTVITSINGSVITLDRPLRRNVESNAQIATFEYSENMVIRDLMFRAQPLDGIPSFYWSRYARGFQVRNVVFDKTWSRAVLHSGFDTLFHGNKFLGQEKNTQFNKGNLWLVSQVQDSEISNNKLIGQELAIELQTQPLGNVIAYNWVGPPDTVQETGDVRCDRGIFLHGDYPAENLFEGNVFACSFEWDHYWGQQGEHNWVYRNRGIDNQTHWSEGFSIWPGGGVVAPFATIIGNHGDGFGEKGAPDPATWGFYDRHMRDLWMEKNVCWEGADCLRIGDPSAVRTTAIDNAEGVDTNPPDWSSDRVPSSLYMDRTPTWWTGATCSFEDAHRGVGAWGDDRASGYCTIPAENL